MKFGTVLVCKCSYTALRSTVSKSAVEISSYCRIRG